MYFNVLNVVDVCENFREKDNHQVADRNLVTQMH